MARKSREAFRTISEVAEWLDVPTHVLRFWESRFSQIKPVKRAGGRRYYRPSDMRIIGGVKTLLHDQGMTIRGVQKLFREEGIKHVSSYSPRLDGELAETERTDEKANVIEGRAVTAPLASPALTSRNAQPDPVVDPTAAPTAEGDIAPASPPVPPSPEPAEPDVIEATAEETPSDDDVIVTEATPVFSHRRSEPAAAPKAPEAEAAPKPTIPPTPDVPDEDPLDDAPEFAAPPGIAARVILASKDDLAANTADLAEAAKRLKAILERTD